MVLALRCWVDDLPYHRPLVDWRFSRISTKMAILLLVFVFRRTTG